MDDELSHVGLKLMSVWHRLPAGRSRAHCDTPQTSTAVLILEKQITVPGEEAGERARPSGQVPFQSSSDVSALEAVKVTSGYIQLFKREYCENRQMIPAVGRPEQFPSGEQVMFLQRITFTSYRLGVCQNIDTTMYRNISSWGTLSIHWCQISIFKNVFLAYHHHPSSEDSFIFIQT